MSVLVTMAQPQQIQQRFVDQTISYHSDTAGPDPELKKILPLVFASLNADSVQISQSDSDSEFFAPMYVDNSQGVIKKSTFSEKILPINADDLKGISTYFSGYHPGVDYRAKIGTPIHAALPGVVNELSFERGGYGRYIVLVHHVDGRTLFTLYAHMRSTEVTVGETVEAGEKIGEVGLTGHTTGPHLHFEIHDTLKAMDPVRFFAGNNIALLSKKTTI